jgi:excinuclease ABC subunit A
MHDLVKDGNSVLLVDHDLQILRESDYMIEMGPEAGLNGGQVIATGTIEELKKNPDSVIGECFNGKHAIKNREEDIFAHGKIHMETEAIHTVKPLSVDIPKNRLTVVTGVSGSGKTTMVLESLVPAVESLCSKKIKPDHVKTIEADGIEHIKLIDATPIGINVRSTVATYANVHDELRKIFGRSPSAKAKGYKAGDFSYNTGSLRCPVCDGTGQISLDVQFLPDVDVPCPDCRGSRYSKTAKTIRITNKSGEAKSMPELMDMDVNTALSFCKDMKRVQPRLEILKELGLGYLTLGEETPGLSGGEAQRLKLAGEMGRAQSDSIFVFDEPTIGLHPKDVETLLGVFDTLIDLGATIIVIEHDLDVIHHADYIIDMGPEGGELGGIIVASGTPDEIKNNPESITGRYL